MDFAPVAFGLDPLSLLALAGIIVVLGLKMKKNWGF